MKPGEETVLIVTKKKMENTWRAMKKVEIIPIAQRKAERRGIQKEEIEDVIVSYGGWHGGGKLPIKSFSRITRSISEGYLWVSEEKYTVVTAYITSQISVIERRAWMKIEYDPKHDILNIEFIAEEDIAIIELDGELIIQRMEIVAIEILDAGARTTENPSTWLVYR